MRKKSPAYKLGLSTIAEICKERIKRVGLDLFDKTPKENNLDTGFRVFKIDTSNMEDVYYNPDEFSQVDLLSSSENIKADRTEEDLLFQIIVDWGVDLTLPIKKDKIDGKTVFFVDQNALVACFDDNGTIDESFRRKIS